MHARRVFVCVFAVLLVGGTRAAPLADSKTKEKRDVSESQPSTEPVRDQEAELESLVSLAGEATKEKNVAVHESHVSHTENINGQEVKAEQTEQKVTNTKTGEVLADVKQVSETEADAQGEPHQVSETKVDIPSKGVHETFVKEEEPLMQEEGEGSIEFTPTVVAKYLLQSGDVDNFDAALKDLVSTNVMSKEDAAQYRQEVEAEYERLVAEEEDLGNNYVNEDFLDGYYPAYDLAEEKRSNMAPFQPDDLYNYAAEYEGYPGSDLDLDRQAFVQDALSGEEDDSLSSIIDALLNAWWQKDFEGGNVKAQNLVSYLYDYVSTDTNPDDIGQIRDILADMLANALLTDVQEAETEYNMEQAIADGEEASQEATEEATGAEQEAQQAAASAPAPEVPAAAAAEVAEDKDVEELKNMAQTKDTADEITKTDAKTEAEESGEKAEDKKEDVEEK